MHGGARLVALIAVAATGFGVVAPARADDGIDRDDGEVFVPPLAIPKGRTYSERIADQLTVLGDTIDGHVGPLTLDTVKFRVDGRARRANLRLAGETRYLSLHVRGDVHFRRGAAEVDAAIDLVVGGHALRLELPDFEVLPRSYLGERYVEVRVPLVRGSF